MEPGAGGTLTVATDDTAQTTRDGALTDGPVAPSCRTSRHSPQLPWLRLESALAELRRWPHQADLSTEGRFADAG
jgi:hypothetical protein